MSMPNPELVSMLDKMDEQMNDIRNSIKIIESNNRRITEDIPKTLEKMQILNKHIDEMKELVTYNDEDQVQKRNHQHETRKKMFAKFFEELGSRISANPGEYSIFNTKPVIFTFIKPENIDRHILCIDNSINTAREKHGSGGTFFNQTNDYYIEKIFDSILNNKALFNHNKTLYCFHIFDKQFSLNYNVLVGEWSVLDIKSF
jgi:ribosomal protein L17